MKMQTIGASKSRDYQLDRIRSLAIIFVISVHSLARIGFYQESILGLGPYVSMVLRTLYITCVPLFLLLSGFLQNKKTSLSLDYYKKIIRIIALYFIAGLACEAFDLMAHNKSFSLKALFLDFVGFKAAPYAWYIEMYMGLFLIIPFLNILWSNLDDGGKKKLVLTALTITVMPSFLCVFDFEAVKWWYTLKDNFTQMGVVYWEPLYPLSYYFIGAYICDYKEKLIRKTRAWSIPLLMLGFGTLNYLKNRSTLFPWTYDMGYSGYQCVLVGTIVFLCCLKYQGRDIKMWNIVSKYSLGMYLCSYIADSVVYHFVNKFFSDYYLRLLLTPVSILAVIVFSLLMSIPCTIIVDRFSQRVIK